MDTLEEGNGQTKQALAQIIELVPEQNRAQANMLLLQTVSRITTHFSGPLPRPADLARYEAIQAGFAERIMLQAEREQAHRHQFTDRHLEHEFGLKGRGQNYALLSVIILTIFALALAFLGATMAAASVATIAILGIVGIFVTGRVIDSRQPEDDDED